MLPMLLQLADGQPRRVLPAISDVLADQFNLTEEERLQPHRPARDLLGGKPDRRRGARGRGPPAERSPEPPTANRRPGGADHLQKRELTVQLDDDVPVSGITADELRRAAKRLTNLGDLWNAATREERAELVSALFVRVRVRDRAIVWEGVELADDALLPVIAARIAAGTVVAAVMEARLAPEEIDALSDELRRRLASPTPGTSDKEGRPFFTAGDYAVAPPDGREPPLDPAFPFPGAVALSRSFGKGTQDASGSGAERDSD